MGMLAPAFFIGASQKEKESDIYLQGVKDGQSMKKLQFDVPMSQTLKELFDKVFKSDFNKFIGATDGIIYGVEKSGQTFIIFIDTMDELCTYYKKPLLEVVQEGQYIRPIIRTQMV
jgi:hypothetical protein